MNSTKGRGPKMLKTKLLLATVLAAPLALSACASQDQMDAMRQDIAKANSTASEAQASAAQASADAKRAADAAEKAAAAADRAAKAAEMASTKADRAYREGLRK
ncbi:MAG TPA: Lpp/OprI family alanine-zipper lipoprotein [Alphaproteobacteria bacterium]|nr:Lpp/OprI family alanine-zipper lipoprotein [Alphaproteobacteria bacterium]